MPKAIGITSRSAIRISAEARDPKVGTRARRRVSWRSTVGGSTTQMRLARAGGGPGAGELPPVAGSLPPHFRYPAETF